MEKAIEKFASKISKYFKTLTRFEETTIDEFMLPIALCVEKQDWPELDKRLGSVKNMSHTIGAGKVYYACHYI